MSIRIPTFLFLVVLSLSPSATYAQEAFHYFTDIFEGTAFRINGKPGSCVVSSVPGNRVQGDVIRVSDGDTVAVTANGTTLKIRLLSIDTPETHYNGHSQGYWGEEASKKMAALLPLGTTVDVELDQERCDHYGRVLGHIFKGNEHINQTMLEEGLAVNYCIYPNTAYCDTFATVVERSIQAKKGIYGDKVLEIPYEWRRVVSNRPYEKYVGNIFTHEVLHPPEVEQVPLAERVFFFHKGDVEPPYHVVD